MNEKRMLCVIVLAVLVATSVCVACVGVGQTGPSSTEEPVLSTYISDDNAWAFIAPDGMDVSTLAWNYKEEKSEWIELINLPDQDYRLTAGAVGYKMHSETIRDLLSVYDVWEQDWYASSYTMRSKEYDVDAPYDTDGTDEPFKYCLRIVEGKEDEAIKCIGTFESFGDALVVRTSKFGCYRESEDITDSIIDRLVEAGVDINSGCYDEKYEAIEIGINEGGFNEETFAFIKALANETGRVFMLRKSWIDINNCNNE